MSRHGVLAIDQGTTGTTVILYDEAGQPIDKSYREFTQHYPRPGWVEHDPEEIWNTVQSCVADLMAREPTEVHAVGITNQRETTVVWDRRTGQPVHPAIVWQCRRTAPDCDALQPHAERFKAKTGLPVDAYFSGTKIAWILKHVDIPGDADLAFGTIDSWLIWKLTSGAVHATDYTNASRTLVYNIHDRCWDEDLLDLLDIPMTMLPEVRPSKGSFGTVSGIEVLQGVPIGGVAGDQQAALFGQACFERGEIKNTYGTGCFMMLNTGDEAVISSNGLLTTLAVNGEGQVCYALEGAIFIAGAAIQWIRDELELIQSASETEAMALMVEDNAGVYLVPAFVGLGAPHWDMEARGIVTGLTRGAGKNHLVRAALESMAYQSADVLRCMEADTGISVSALAVDGGAVANNFLMQFQADMLGIPVMRPAVIESTSLGAAYLAGLHAGVWSSSAELTRLKAVDREFKPSMTDNQREALLAGWQKALRQAMTR
jgi:glycerol kinase